MTITVEIRAERWTGTADSQTIERATPTRYTTDDPATALGAYAAEHPDICDAEVNRQGWRLTCVLPGTGKPPSRRPMNWQRDPDAEVSDGWLSNIAAAGNNLTDRLTWEPQFCTNASRSVPCPACTTPLREYTGKWGAFYHCECGWKAGVTTKKAAAAETNTQLTGWCGTRLVVRYNHHGVPYAGCPTCDPAHTSPTVNDIYAGTTRNARRW